MDCYHNSRVFSPYFIMFIQFENDIKGVSIYGALTQLYDNLTVY